MNRPSAEFEGAILTKPSYTSGLIQDCVNLVTFSIPTYWEENLSSVPQRPSSEVRPVLRSDMTAAAAAALVWVAVAGNCIPFGP